MVKDLRFIIIALVIISMLAPCIAAAAGETPEQLAYKALSYELITDEVHYAITKDLDLEKVAEKLGGEVTVTWKSSDTSVIDDDGSIARDAYRNQDATLTATIGTGSDALTKEFDFTVLSAVTKTYYSETFYYPEYEGMLVSDASDNWSFSRTTTLDGDGMKTVIVKDDADTTNYYTRGYRSGESVNVHYTIHNFEEKLNGNLSWEADVMFDNTVLPQLYMFEFYADHQVGQYTDSVQIVDLRLQFYDNGEIYTYGRYYNGDDIKNVSWEKSSTAIKEKQWARVRLDIDTENQVWDIYVDGERLSTSSVPFLEKNREGFVRENLLGITHYQYGPFREYTEGNGVCLDNVSVRDDNHIYSENAQAYEVADMIELPMLTDEAADSLTEDMDLSLSSLQNVIESRDITITWESSNQSALSISGDTARVYRDKEAHSVVLTANIVQAGKSHTVKKQFNLTVLPDEDYIRVYNVYRGLTEECFTTEPADAISTNLNFSNEYVGKHIDLNGINLDFTSSNESAIGSDGTVNRGEEKCSATVSVVITDNSTDAYMEKTFDYTLLEEDIHVYYSSNFAYPELENKDLANLEHWSNSGAKAGERFTTTLIKEESNYLLMSERGEADDNDVTFNKLTLADIARGNVTFSTRLKFEHDKYAGMYVFYINGLYQQDDVVESMRVGEIRFDYEKMTAHIPHYQGSSISSEIVSTLPPVGEWFDLRMEFDILSQGYDIYINGERYNTHTIPFYKAFGDDEQQRYCIGIDNIRYNTYRKTSYNKIYTDDMCVTGKRYLQSYCEIYENGVKVNELKYIDGFEGNSYDMTARLVNDTDYSKELDLYVAVYDNDKLVSVRKKSSLSLEAGEFRNEQLEDIQIPQNLEKVEIKVFMIDEKLVPVEVNGYIPSDVIKDYEGETYYFSDTGRTMHYVDLHGKIAYKPYFNAQCWSADSKKLYIQGKDYTIYEYYPEENTLRFISEGSYYYGIVTTPQNKLIFSNKQKQIIEMDCDTYQKRLVANLPEGQTNEASQLTVSNDGKKLCVIWKDTLGGMENSDTLENRRFPILDMETGEWNLESYFGFEDAPPYNLGMNPAYPNLILFNHCAVEGDTFDRNWVMDTNTGIADHRFKQKGYSDNETGEVISHETWSYDGELLYIDKAIGSRIGMGGVMSFDKDGNNRRHINDDYSYLHLGVNPVNPRFIVSDTGYGNSHTSDIVVVDCHSGKSYKLATTNQRGDDSVAHSHPAFTPDGQAVYFGVFNGDYTSAGIGYIDVSDIVNQPDLMEVVTLSENCTAESYEGMSHELTVTTKAGQGGYNIANGNYMRVNYKGSVKENASAEIEITYFADGGEMEIGYYVWTEDAETHNSLDAHTYIFEKENTDAWVTAVITIDDINFENMGHMGSDFYVKGIGSDLAVKAVKVTEK